MLETSVGPSSLFWVSKVGEPVALQKYTLGLRAYGEDIPDRREIDLATLVKQ